MEINPGECQPLWPRSEREDKLLWIKCATEPEVTAPFICNNVQTTLLKLNNKYGGVQIEIQVSEGSVYITMMTYALGMAPALVVNNTDVELSFWEKDSINVRQLPAKHRMYYTWENPAGPRKLLFDTGKKNDAIENELIKDDTGSFTLPDNTEVFFATFLSGMQRTVLFSRDLAETKTGLDAHGLEARMDQEIELEAHGVGLSLVDDSPTKMREICYIGIASSGVIWEARKLSSKRYKQLSIGECERIEAAYQKYQNELQMYGSSPNPKVYIDDKTEVDFKEMVAKGPHSPKCLRRTYRAGAWLCLGTSAHLTHLHARLHRLQADCQLPDAAFPVVLAPVAPPKSLADIVMKPFAELSVVQRKLEHSSVKQYKYCRLLIQEFHVKLDLGFVNAIVDMFQPDEISDKEAASLFSKDLALVDQSLKSLVTSQSLQEQKSFYDCLHFSPLKIHVSFSMSGSGANSSGGGGGGLPDFLSVLLQGVGVTLTDMHDVVFRLSYFERNYCFLSQKQLISEATKHYTGQAVKQLYVLVLGLDVIGNPFGLVVGISKGVEDLFYEPFQGAIQGPGEFAEGLVLGMRSLFGHTVGGAAGAFSRITGAMGKGLATLTFDKEFQRKRMDQLNKKPANLQEGLARSGKGLVMGVFDGVTGVVTQPLAGARSEGVEGFFRGLGRGAAGLLARPTAGVVDFASGSFDAVKRATDISDEVSRLRPPRLLSSAAGGGVSVTAYNRHEADGAKLLGDLEKGRYIATDQYRYHLEIASKDTLLLTDKRVVYAIKNELFGGWQVEWSYTWHEIKTPVTAVPRGVLLSVSEPKKKVLGMFSAKDSGKLILVNQLELREDLVRKMEALRKNV